MEEKRPGKSAICKSHSDDGMELRSLSLSNDNRRAAADYDGWEGSVSIQWGGQVPIEGARRSSVWAYGSSGDAHE